MNTSELEQAAPTSANARSTEPHSVDAPTVAQRDYPAVEAISIVERILTTSPNINPESLEKFIALQERVADRDARQAFAASMVAAQAEMAELSIVKDATNDQTSSKYARLGRITKAIAPIYTHNGFSLSFGTQEATQENTVCVVCDVTHYLGWEKRYAINMPIDSQGIKGTVNKTGPHAFGSSTSYARRYLTVMIFNLAILDDEDTDGNSQVSFISEIQERSLREEVGDNMVAFCDAWNIKSLGEIWADNFDNAIQYARDMQQGSQEAAVITPEQANELIRYAHECGVPVSALCSAGRVQNLSELPADQYQLCHDYITRKSHVFTPARKASNDQA